MAKQEWKVKEHWDQEKINRLHEHIVDFFAEESCQLQQGKGRMIERLMLDIKGKSGGVELRVKYRSAKAGGKIAPVVEDASAVKETVSKPKAEKIKFGKLKKDMKSSFKELVAAVQSKKMPADEIVALFLDQSELMVSFPGKGDEFYPAYTTACEMLHKGWQEKDFELLKVAMAEITSQMKACHKIYK